MPGSTHCFQCHQDLAAPPEKLKTLPPRAKRSSIIGGIHRKAPKKPIAPILKSLNSVIPLGLLTNAMIGMISIIPGLGQFLYRRYRRCLLFAVLQLTGIIAVLLSVTHSLFNYILWIVLCIFFSAVFDTALLSIPDNDRKLLEPQELGALTAFICAAFFFLGFTVFMILNHQFMFYRTPYDWNCPVIQHGELLFARRNAYAEQLPKRGDFVMVPIHNGSFARVIGLPNEHIRIQDGAAWIDDQPLPENFDTCIQPRIRFETMLQPDGYLVLTIRMIAHRYQYEPHVVSLEAIQSKVLGVFSPPENRRWIGNER